MCDNNSNSMAGIEDDLPDVEDDLPEVGVDSKDEMDHRSNVGNEEPDLEWIESSPYPGGMVHITEDETPEGKIYDTYYVNVSNTTPVNDVASYIDKAWRLHTPNIILSVITNNKYTDRWKNQTLLEEFQKGIIQAVNSTDMWIITNGLDQGMTKIIGDAIYQEKQQRERPTMDMTLFNFADLQFTEEQTNLTVIGVVPNVNISYKDQMIGKHRQPLSIQNKGRKSKSDIKELNPDHSHFILVNDLEEVDDVENFRLELEERFLLPVGDSKKYRKIVSVEGSDSENDNCPAAATEDVKLVCNTNTPLVGLLLQGGPAQIDHVASLLKKQIPVIVVKGSGYAANLIAFVIQEMQERGDPDHVESYIKPELLSRLTKHFNEEFKDNEIARNKCRDKILECVDMSFQNGQAFLTILETQGLSSDLANLNKSILLALFESQSQTQGAKFEDQLQLDLKLTLDWNTCNLALTQIYQKYDWAKIKVVVKYLGLLITIVTIYLTIVFTISHITRYQPCLLITIVTIVFTISHITRYQPCLLITIVTVVFTVSHITRYQPCLLITIVTVVFTVSHITRYQPCLLITIVTVVFTISHITRYQPCLLITIVTVVFTISHITRYQPCLLITIVTVVFTVSHNTSYQPCLLITIVTVVFTVSHITRYQPCLLITIVTVVFTISHITRYQPCLLITIVTVVFTISHITRYQPCLLITIVTVVFTISHITRYQPCLLITMVTVVFTISHITRYQPCLLITMVTVVFTISHITRYQPCLLITMVTVVFTISHITRYQPCLLITMVTVVFTISHITRYQP
ncbi:hypothetical protein KUTeg_017315 [Tegillarca granosa]|uniref:TRPM SLOG domain-containing protein n=1 Tax=Tegillarca granosa TaxID=220873 RepID=A0ABQ9EP13_TEGGR|nr:hypothetical protein KUTeg_017315 [Tegillarca granosa]